MNQVRVFPTLMILLAVLFGVKVVDLWTGYQAIAASAKKDDHGAASSKDYGGDHKEDKHGDDKHGDDHGGSDHGATDGEHHGDKGDKGDHGDQAAAKKPPGSRIVRQPIPGEAGMVSASEVEVLQRLGERRKSLDEREDAMEMKEKLLAATEKRIDEKIAQLKQIEDQIKSSLTSLDDQEAAQMKSLVKVYETMKPKDAAPILQTLDRPILLQVVSRMKEAKMAAILAQMEPRVAQEVTVLLATQTEIPVVEGLTDG